MGDVDTDVPMLLATAYHWRRVFADGSGLESELAIYVLCHISEEVEDHEEDSSNEMHLVPERRAYDSKTGIEIPREKVLEGRKADMKEMMNRHFFDEVPESEAVGKRLIRAQWLEPTTEARRPTDIAAFEEKRDDKHAMTRPLKVERVPVSRAATGSKSRRRVFGN